ncbi:hypothetical protein SMMN14_02889 [Sphaerulina musiva]
MSSHTQDPDPDSEHQRLRHSTETERTLVEDHVDTTTHPTPRAASPTRTLVDASDSPYRGFPSKAHYLAALHEWAEEKRYLPAGTTTVEGFYGNTTLESYASRPKHELGIRRRLREIMEKKKHTKRSSSWPESLRRAS